MSRRGWRSRLADVLIRWGSALQPTHPVLSAVPAPVEAADQSLLEAPPEPPPDSSSDHHRQAAATKLPGVRAPLSIERAVRSRDLTVLKREACDALAALGAAHAVVTSARLAQIQSLRSEVDRGDASEDDLVELAGDYQAWQNDQVRLFDALALVLGMGVPDGRAFDQIDTGMEKAAQAHLSALAAEYQRRLLSEQFEAGEKEG
ncbi:MAG: hypothetical protein RLZZ516_2740 [Cyanobacteriota bacterium]|jgi:hypothetical protein|nr:hypothetical protein [Synechococcaceae bacterium WB4_1_0192]